MTKPFIGIAGIIGVGKSTLTEKLGQSLGLPVYKEPVAENPFLESFYKDMPRWGFPMQVYLLNARFKQHQEIIWRSDGAVQDRTIYEDTIFAQMLYEDGHMTKKEHQTYVELFCNMTKFLQRPDLIIYLDASPEDALKRIQKRSRSVENGLPLEYLQSLKKGYDRFVDDMKYVLNIRVVNWEKFIETKDLIKDLELGRETTYISNRWGKHF